MALIATDTGGAGDFQLAPAGVHMGRCYRVIDLGTQKSDWQGKARIARKVMLAFEAYCEDDAGLPVVMEDGRPFALSRRYTLSLGEKATLRHDLESWRGRAFTQAELAGFDLASLLRAPCLLNVQHSERAGKAYADITSITPIPKAMRAALPPMVNAPQLFDVNAPDMTIFETFSERLQETIRACAEWQKQKPAAAQADDSWPGDDFDRAPAPAVKPARPVAQAQPAARATLPPYPADRFAANLPAWQETIESGKRTADEVVAMVSTKATLSADQLRIIRSIKPAISDDGVDVEF